MAGVKTHRPPFIQNSKIDQVVATAVAAALTTDAPTGFVLLSTAGANDSIITKLTAMPRATTGATALYLYLSSDNGVTKQPLDSETMPATTVSTGAGTAETNFTNISEDTPFRLAAGQQLYVSLGVAFASGIVFSAHRGDF